MKRQFTSTCYVVKGHHFLLIFHKKHGKWLPPGGHLEEGETPPETALREVKEETGLDVAFCLQENLWYSDWNAKSLPRPFSCLLELIPERGDEPAHEHIDQIFVANPIGGELIDGRWFTLDEVMALEAHKDIFLDTQRTIQIISEQGAALIPPPRTSETAQKSRTTVVP